MEMASLPRAAELAADRNRAGPGNPRWHPGAPLALHSEIFAPADEAGGAGVALAFACAALRQKQAGRKQDGGPQKSDPQGGRQAFGVLEEKAVLWVQDERAIARTGRPYRPGLPAALRHRVIHVAARNASDALFAIEEGLRCRDLACVIGELAGNPKALDFTASRRFSLVAERHGVPLLLVRIDAQADLSSARMRWRVRSAPSAPPLWNRAAPGCPAWHAELFRARAHVPGEWILRDDRDALAAERAAEHAAESAADAAPDHGDLVRAAGA